MTIYREIKGEKVEIVLTPEELTAAYDEKDVLCLAETVKGHFNSGCDDRLDDLSDEEWESAIMEIACIMQSERDKYGIMPLDEYDALAIALRIYFKEDAE